MTPADLDNLEATVAADVAHRPGPLRDSGRGDCIDTATGKYMFDANLVTTSLCFVALRNHAPTLIALAREGLVAREERDQLRAELTNIRRHAVEIAGRMDPACRKHPIGDASWSDCFGAADAVPGLQAELAAGRAVFQRVEAERSAHRQFYEVARGFRGELDAMTEALDAVEAAMAEGAKQAAIGAGIALPSMVYAGSPDATSEEAGAFAAGFRAEGAR